MTVLKISEVKKGHEGVYKCVSQNLHNQIKYNTVEVRVQETGDTQCYYTSVSIRVFEGVPAVHIIS